MKCPVCKLQLTQQVPSFCPQCAWDLKNDLTLNTFLSPISEKDFAIYQNKLHIAKKNWEYSQNKKKAGQTQPGKQGTKPAKGLLNKLVGFLRPKIPPPSTSNNGKRSHVLISPKSVKSSKANNKKSNQQKTPQEATQQQVFKQKKIALTKAEKEQDNVRYSEETPVPDLKRDTFETLEEFRGRICDCKPVYAGKVRLIKERYDIKTGVFPVEISWEEWAKEFQNRYRGDFWLKVDRENARTIYQNSAEYPLYVKLKTREETVLISASEVSTETGVIPLQIPGPAWKEPTTGIELIYVPGGSFMMGYPVHKVNLDEFYIGKYPVTQAQWFRVMKNNPSRCIMDDCPVENVSWEDAKLFLQKLSEKISGLYTFRLPTEAEWEYAARSGGKTETYAGGENIDALAWYRENSYNSTQPVGEKAANGLGIHDMSGNVHEWCEDWFGDSSSGTLENLKESDSGSNRVLRGGCWDSNAVGCQSAERCLYTPGLPNFNIGLRLVLFPDQQ